MGVQVATFTCSKCGKKGRSSVRLPQNGEVRYHPPPNGWRHIVNKKTLAHEVLCDQCRR
jgi:hypothetical protein